MDTRKGTSDEEEGSMKGSSRKAEADQGVETPKIAEGDLRKEELFSLFNLTIDMLCVADINGCFRSINNAWETILGYKEEELLSRPYLDFVHPDFRGGSAGDTATTM